MATKNHATIHNVKGEQLPLAWAKELGLDSETDAGQLIDVTLNIVSQPKKKVSYEQFMKTVKRLQACTDPAKTLTDDDLYDEHGLPK